jgi:pyruvate formate lyase activating enzyme
LELPYYGRISALARDPIEKKPLYHWRPASSIVSAGFFGCNLRCPFCQNWHISQINSGKRGGHFFSPQELIAEAGSQQIAYTYSEPLVHAEYLLDCMAEAHSNGAANVLVTNGCVNAEAAEAILSRTDAANIDLKCFREKTYSSVLGGDLNTIISFICLAVSLQVHTEITTLVVPGMNDSETELMEIAAFIAGLNTKNILIPWHLSAYHPDWRWDAPPTNPSFLSAFAKKALVLLPYVYTGNISGEQNDTLCGECGALLVKRRGYSVEASGLCLPEGTERKNKPVFYECAKCGTQAPIRWR